MKVALVHDWLTGMRGGEKVLEALCEIFPDAPVFTLVHAPGSVSAAIEKHPIIASPLQKFPRSKTLYRHYLPFMPWAVRRLDLSGHELVVSSSHCAAKGVRAPPGALHICYCHTPMRYVWDQYEEYFGPGRASLPVRLAMAGLRKPLQSWDRAVNAGVHEFIANSRHVARRIERFYGRTSTVIAPPLDFDGFSPGRGKGDFYLAVSALVPYKRMDVAVEAFNRSGRPLKIVGSGPERARLERLARPNVEFLGWKSDAELREYYGACRALIFPGEEDFGIVPLEAMASGKPVIALGRGGALETVIPPGRFFQEPTAAALAEAVELFEKSGESDPGKLRAHARAFDKTEFKGKITKFIETAWTRFQEGPRP